MISAQWVQDPEVRMGSKQKRSATSMWEMYIARGKRCQMVTEGSELHSFHFCCGVLSSTDQHQNR